MPPDSGQQASEVGPKPLTSEIGHPWIECGRCGVHFRDQTKAAVPGQHTAGQTYWQAGCSCDPEQPVVKKDDGYAKAHESGWTKAQRSMIEDQIRG